MLLANKRILVTTVWTSEQREVVAALRAGITEVAFFKVSSTTLSIVEAKQAVENGLVAVLEAVKKYGNARGAAIGWGTYFTIFILQV
jgi:ribosomal protein L7/L12